ncbi:wax ester/triacylglycerol synthase domain-containing protein [Actinophytocola sp.]|uniref:wax ester/triacylglycerol synthase domain-containing protein n=1 Tax=Actinophytocola sp. TaxID=1872138 RepID=UPI002D7FC7CF|nr:wax ester/triacylglycerol synthase domain-containing protein [Actinophytocola sp.]HET9140760.1 wax ester/triacylglycerol synthase domain-containing protein [Actinophytocola sp.]
MERLGAEDLLMLWPDAAWPQEIGALAVLDGAALFEPGGRFRIEAVRAAVQARLHLAPRLRQVLAVPRRGLGGPLWTDAPSFDIAQHVRVVPLTAPGDEGTLLSAVERLCRHRLDRSQPLWQLCFLPGLPGRRVGLFIRLHHVLADGVAGIATIGALLDTATVAPVPPWAPAPQPAAWELFVDNLQRHRDKLRATLAHPARAARRLHAALPPVPTGAAAPATSLNRFAGPDRSLALVRADLKAVKRIAHAHGGTVNDVLLAVTAGGLAALLRGRGERVDGLNLPVYVPVSLRPEPDRAQARGNLIGQMVVPLPVGIADPGLRLYRIAAETTVRKAMSHPPLGSAFGGRIARRALLSVLDRYPVNVTTADLTGPPRPVSLAGARLLEVFPILPLIANVALGVGALSYTDQFAIAVTADRDAYPDLDVFTTGLREQLAVLDRSVPVAQR